MIRFTVEGKPQPQGSSRMFPVKTPAGNHMILTSANRALKPWRKLVSVEAQQAEGAMIRLGPLRLTASFYFAPPKKMPKDRHGMTTKPDIDKLIRGIADALTGILYLDDSQIVETRALKLYGLPERAEIELEYL